MRIYWMHEAKMLTAVVPDGAVSMDLDAPCPNHPGGRINCVYDDDRTFLCTADGGREAQPVLTYENEGDGTLYVKGVASGQVLERTAGGGMASSVANRLYSKVSIGPVHGELPEGPERALLSEAAEVEGVLDLIAKGAGKPVLPCDPEQRTARAIEVGEYAFVREKMYLRVYIPTPDLWEAVLPAHSVERAEMIAALRAEMADGWQQVGRAMTAAHPNASEFRVILAARLKRVPEGQVRIIVCDDEDGYTILAGCYYFAIEPTK